MEDPRKKQFTTLKSCETQEMMVWFVQNKIFICNFKMKKKEKTCSLSIFDWALTSDKW